MIHPIPKREERGGERKESRGCLHAPVIPAFEKLRREGCLLLEASLGSIVSGLPWLQCRKREGDGEGRIKGGGRGGEEGEEGGRWRGGGKRGEGGSKEGREEGEKEEEQASSAKLGEQVLG